MAADLRRVVLAEGVRRCLEPRWVRELDGLARGLALDGTFVNGVRHGRPILLCPSGLAREVSLIETPA